MCREKFLKVKLQAQRIREFYILIDNAKLLCNDNEYFYN